MVRQEIGKRTVRLRFYRGEGENEAVRARMQLTVCALVVLSIFPAGMAQNQDRDLYKPSKTSANAPAPEARIDINHATLDELLKIPGLPRSWAGRIVRFRPYRTKADLRERGILSGEVYDRVKDYVIAHREEQ